MKPGLLALASLAVLAPQVAGFESPQGRDPAPVEIASGPPPHTDRPQAPFLPSPSDIVEGMLELAGTGEGDVVYDLGCGDGRIVIAAINDFGALRGVCVEIDPLILEQARENARFYAVEDRIEFVEGDLFEVDLAPATVVTLYLLQQVNLELRPKLWRELRPGTRVVSHRFHMGDWEADEEVRFYGRSVYLWTIREPVARHRDESLGLPD